MNAELYILRSRDASGEITTKIPVIADTLKKAGIVVAYKTELDEKREKIVYSIADSLKPEENINAIFVPNAFESNAEDTVIYKTLSAITATGGTADKKRLEDVLCGFTGDFEPATPINSDGNRYGYIFLVNGVKIVLLPVVSTLPAISADKTVDLIKEAIKALLGEEAVEKMNADSSSPKQTGHLAVDFDKVKTAKTTNKNPVKPSTGMLSVEPFVEPVIESQEEPSDEAQEDGNAVNLVNNSFELKESVPIAMNTAPVNNTEDDPNAVSLISGMGGASEKKEDKAKEKELKEQEKREREQRAREREEERAREKREKEEQRLKEKEEAKPKHQKKGPTFKERFIPLKEDDGKEKARKIVLDIAIIVFIVTAIILTKVAVIDPFLNNKKYDELRETVKNEIEIATEVTTDAEGNEVVRKIKTNKDWKKLKDINKEVIAWVQIKDTNVDYPVLQHKEDTLDYQYYLYKDIYKEYSGYGSVFADFRSNRGVDSKNIILHGHNMKDGSMFENLMGYGKYKPDMDYYRKHPTIEFDTPKGVATYKIISVFKTSTLDAHGEFFNYLTASFSSDAEFMNYVYLVRERSLIDTGVTCNEDDQLLTLSTCSYEYSDFRTVVVARKTRVGESSKVDVSKAKANSDPLWPDVYYNYDKSSKPKVTTFKTENKKKKIAWYDGKGNLDGRERMFTLHDNDRPKNEDASEETTENITQPPTEAPIIHPEGVMLDYSQMVMDIGDIETLKIIWSPENTTEKSGVKWISSNANVARVASGGRVTAVGPGECTITVQTANGHEYSTTVIVNGVLATKLTLSSSSYRTNKLGETFLLAATYEPSNVTNKAISWTSSDNSVATVTSGGLVKITGYGSCTITAKLDSLTCRCTITVIQPATNPPATNPPATNPPATNPPATNPPATNPPVTPEPEPTPEVTAPVEE
ncbi:MAG: class B sortase [Clostridia bacterium]|nr:class B sortase [Clostridia bacterium]